MKTVRWLLTLVVMTIAAPAFAQSDDDGLRAKARDLAVVGGELYQQAQYAEALVKLDEAYRILRVPTLGFYSGQCLEQLGRWVEAADRYQEVTNLALPERARELHAEARESAARARSALLPRIPRLRIAIAIVGRARGPLQVFIDGKLDPSFEPGEAISMDPGEHGLVARAGEDRAEQAVIVREGTDQSVTLKIVVPEKPAPAPAPPTIRSEPADPTVMTAGYVVLGVGAAALVGGVITGAVLMAEKASLDDVCADRSCSGAAEVDTYNALRPTTTVLLAAGGAGVAAGLVMIFAFGGDASEAGLSPIVAPGWLGVRGSFW